MASFNVYLEVIQASKFFFQTGRSLAPVTDTQRRRIIQDVGVIDNVQSTSTTTFYLWDTTSDITGYRYLLTATAGLRVELSVAMDDTLEVPYEFALEEFTTQQNSMEGKNSRGTSTTFSMQAYHDGDPDRVVKIVVEIYHRTSGGTETLITEYEETISTTSTTYTESVTLNATWQNDERMVIKVRARDEGIPV